MPAHCRPGPAAAATAAQHLFPNTVPLQVLTYGGIQGLKETRQRSEDIVTLTIEGNGKISWTRDGNPAVRPPGALASAGVKRRVKTCVLRERSANALADSHMCWQMRFDVCHFAWPSTKNFADPWPMQLVCI